jgi:hypothetical protein
MREVSSELRTDDPRFPNWTYRLRFESFPRVQILPERIDLGTFRAGKFANRPATARLEIFAAPGEEMSGPGKLKVPDGMSVTLDRRPERTKFVGGVRRDTYHFTVRLREEPTVPGPSVSHIEIATDKGPRPPQR